MQLGYCLINLLVKSFYFIQGVLKWFSCSSLNLTLLTLIPYCILTLFTIWHNSNSLLVFGAWTLLSSSVMLVGRFMLHLLLCVLLNCHVSYLCVRL